MPIYEYTCCDCDAMFEVLVRDGEPVVCPHCGSVSLNKLLSAPVMLSGRTARPAGRTPPTVQRLGAVGRNDVRRRLAPQGASVGVNKGGE